MASLQLQFSMINAYLYQLQYLYHFIQSYHIHVQYPPRFSSYLSRRMDKYGVASNRVYNFWNSPLSRQRGLLPTSQSRGLCGFPSRQLMAQNPHPNVRLMGVIIPPLPRIWKFSERRLSSLSSLFCGNWNAVSRHMETYVWHMFPCVSTHEEKMFVRMPWHLYFFQVLQFISAYLPVPVSTSGFIFRRIYFSRSICSSYTMFSMYLLHSPNFLWSPRSQCPYYPWFALLTRLPFLQHC